MWLNRRVLVVALLLLASVGTASAECAWVLWQEWGGGLRQVPGGWENPHRYAPVWTYGTREECEQLGIARHTLPTGYIRTICLPDTVDPRGRKGQVAGWRARLRVLDSSTPARASSAPPSASCGSRRPSPSCSSSTAGSTPGPASA